MKLNCITRLKPGSLICGMLLGASFNAGAQTQLMDLVVRAKGDLSANIGPQMSVRVNGSLIGATEVRSQTFQNYVFKTVRVPNGAMVDIVFDNDVNGANGDRNLYVESINVNGNTLSSSSSGVSLDIGFGYQSFDGLNVSFGQGSMFSNSRLRFPIGAPNTTASSWKNVAAENGSYAVNPPQTVRYGVGTTWVYKIVFGTLQCSNAFFGSDPAPAVLKGCEVPTSTNTLPPVTIAPWLPNDPFFATRAVAGPITAPPTYQWGLHAMNFPLAWAKVRGQSYIGLIEGDRPSTHEDLKRNYRQHFDNCESDSICGFGYVPHATHVAGIVAAQTNNNKGVAGACPECSVAAFGLASGSTDIQTSFSTAIRHSLDAGMQVLNWSGSADGDGFRDCASAPALCSAMELAKKRDVLLVQAAGNFRQSRPPFPSFNYSDFSVLPVGGTAMSAPRVGDPQALWTYYGATNIGSAFASVNGVIAPSKSILSTFAPGQFVFTDSSEPDAFCGDVAGRDQSEIYNDGYGTCTGTSMAAPHVSALAGLVRSINPLLSADQVRQIIRNSGNLASTAVKTPELGWGLPDAAKAVDAALATTPTRLTPLFSFYSEDRSDSFYTSVPQMARAALGGTLLPKREAKAYNSAYGPALSTYTQFPDPLPPVLAVGGSPTTDRRPRAEVFVFTTSTNPKNASVPLIPLYRLSWKCGDATPGAQPAVCSSKPSHIDVTYTGELAGLAAFEALGYKLDGIEGYIYPKSAPQPAGTVRLMRKYNPTRDDHAIFPEGQLTYMQSLGYTDDSGSDWLGYVYPHNGVAITTIP